MNKKQFETFLNKHLQELSTKKQCDLIKKIQNVWLPEILEKS